MVLLAGSLGAQIEAAVGAQEPAFIAKYAFQLAQAFNLFYHHHRVLTEEDAAKKMFFAATEPSGGSPASQRASDVGNRIAREDVAQNFILCGFGFNFGSDTHTTTNTTQNRTD